MKPRILIKTMFLPLLLCGLASGIFTGRLAGQDVIQPLSPRLDNVTVDPGTGFALLRWLPSPSADVERYVVYTYSGGTASAIDTIRSPFILEYTHTASAARYRSVTYVVAAVDSSENISPLSNSLGTIWLSAENDVCTGRITVKWTPYENQYHPGTGYTLHISEDGGITLPDVTLPFTDNEYILSGYDPDTEYCFHVTATDDVDPLSSSNRACVTTGSEVPPSWISIGSISVEGGGLTVAAAYDPATLMHNYGLHFYNPGTGIWDEAATSSGSSGSVSFVLVPADTAVARLYRVAALNSCGVAAAVSSSARNIVLESSVTGTLITLKWNRPVPGGSETFTVWRDTGSNLREVASSLTDTIWSEDYTMFASEVSSGKVVYRVTAGNTGAPPGTPPHLSSAAEVVVSENVFMPNAFTPGSNDENALFRPEFSFLPREYDFRIMSRTGVLLYRTGDPGEGWDGRHEGKPMPAGVYLWSLKLSTPSGSMVVRSGTVTILP